jgi:hypothetical protein
MICRKRDEICHSSSTGLFILNSPFLGPQYRREVSVCLGCSESFY